MHVTGLITCFSVYMSHMLTGLAEDIEELSCQRLFVVRKFRVGSATFRKYKMNTTLYMPHPLRA